MFCSQCGAKIDPSSRFCSSCGAKIQPTDPLESNSSLTPLQPLNEPVVPVTLKRRPMPTWFKILAALAVLALIAVTAGILFTESLVDAVDHQLEALRKDDLPKAYYGYTSKDFQQATSPEEFRQFVQAYPILTENQSAHFTQRSVKDNIGTLKGNLTSKDHVSSPVEFKLIKEEDKWKILSIRLLKTSVQNPSKEANQPENLIEVAKAQLKTIQDNNLQEAYEKYTAKEFQAATSFEQFKEFIQRYPILTQYRTVSFHKPNIRAGGIGTLAAILQSNQGAADVKYYFIYEDQAWKVWSLRISSSFDAKEEGSDAYVTDKDNHMSLGLMTVGDQVDEQGLITHPKTNFSPDLQNLYVDIEVKNGVKDSVINLNLQHQESGSSIPTKATIEENGDSLLMSVFTPPSTGWPKGHYKLFVTTSSGLSQVITFQIDP